ncbi:MULTISPECIES: hypothetical protein [unclassified Anaerobiospirillum]|uniref:hypothetical protein n=1 Tax=unclassified Anaerobiospirillum TaxID=2647410 RepID=UPI001FF50272|nr:MULTISPECIES: hypothetical protein [unclassified Anaerobiospirillum]MCK0534560.1 hypothetical protein [Anaerobiospirillum sp. NML120511]MCK0540643.1 hypothetical protein [Anaerobiospirillum sp. NML02-A-032]
MEVSAAYFPEHKSSIFGFSFMNKFSSLSTSVLLALLTSSAAVAAYASGAETISSRTTARSTDSTESNSQRQGASRARNPEEDLEPHSLPVINGTYGQLSNEFIMTSENGTYIAMAPASASKDPFLEDLDDSLEPDADGATPAPHGSLDSSSLLASAAAPAPAPANALAESAAKKGALTSDEIISKEQRSDSNKSAEDKSSASSTVAAGNLQLSLKRCDHVIALNPEQMTAQLPQAAAQPAPAPGSVDDLSGVKSLLPSGSNYNSLTDRPDGADSKSALAGMVGSSDKGQVSGSGDADGSSDTMDSDMASQGRLSVSFDYPEDMKESYMVAGDSTVISYSSDKTNFMITLKVTPLDESQPLSYKEFRDGLLKRFRDKENMLYGEYEEVRALRNTSEAIEWQNKNPSVFAAPINPHDHYMELVFYAFLKKGEDGVLPDMQNYFYERNIVSHNTMATLRCELVGRQVQAANVKQQFETLKPVFERILDSYRFDFEY